MTAEYRCELANRVAQHCYDNTETFSVLQLGTHLAYTLWAITADDNIPFDTSLTKSKAFENIVKEAPDNLWQELLEGGFIK